MVGQRCLLNVGRIGPVRILADESLPLWPPVRHQVKGGHLCCGDGFAICVGPKIATTNKIQISMVEIVIRPFVYGDALRWQSVPVVQVSGEQGDYRCSLMMAEVMLPHLTAVVGKALWKFL